MKKLSTAAALAAALASPWAAAESNINTAAGPNSTATARLDFTVVIPRVLYLQVGTGTPLTSVATVDSLSFNPAAASLGNGTAVAGTGGDAGPGKVTVRVLGNNGDIGLTAAITGQLSNGTQTIPWSDLQITTAAAVTPAAGFTATAIPHPAIPSTTTASTGAATAITSTNKVVAQEGTWTFKYANTSVYAAGTYGATVANNGRITYTATLP